MDQQNERKLEYLISISFWTFLKDPRPHLGAITALSDHRTHQPTEAFNKSHRLYLFNHYGKQLLRFFSKMGANCSSQQHEDIFTSRKHSQSFSNGSNSSSVSISSIDFETTKHREDFAITSASADSQKPYEMEKMRVMKSKIILLIGENRIKVATACYIKSISATNTVQVIVGTRDPDAAKNSLLLRAGVRLIKADMTSPETLLRAIRDTKADTVFLVSPNQVDRSTQTTTGITACKRAGVGHVVVLSSTCVDREGSSIFGDQCKLLESFVKKSGMAYSLVRIPMLMDNYLSQLQSMAEYGIFYRPLPPNTKRNAVTG